MPTDTEIQQHQEKYGVRVWGISREGRNPCRLGDIAVVPFYDHVDAIRTAVDTERDRIREGVLNFYAIAPKAAAPMLRVIDEGWNGQHG